MKHTLLITLFSLLSIVSRAKDEVYLWPIQNEKAGTNILYNPQSYIGDELNFSSLFIGANEGDTVLSPVDGVIYDMSIDYIRDMSYCTSWGLSSDKSFNSNLEYQRKNVTNKSIDKKYIHASMGIRYKGLTIWIGGLTGDQKFKTGQKIKKGTPIGNVGYVYHKIPEPCLTISISKNSKTSDPMTPFGLKSSFIPHKEIEPIEFLTKEQVKEDFLIYINALKENFPGLYDVLTKEELEQYTAENLKYIDNHKGDFSINDFNLLMSKANAKIHDCHINSRGYAWKSKAKNLRVVPAILFNWIQDTLRCSLTSKGYEDHFKKEIISVNGVSADSLKSIVSSRIGNYDAKVKEFAESRLWSPNIMYDLFQDDNYEMEVEFMSGEIVSFKNVSSAKPFSGYTLGRDTMNFSYYRINREKNYTFKELNDSTSYLGIGTFSLNEVEVSEIGSYIDSISHKQHLIIDVRNNNGGDVIQQIFSYIALKPIKLNGYSKVNKVANYEYLKYSTNYAGVDSIFYGYKQIEGKDGFYSLPDTSANTLKIDSSANTLKIDSLISFKNKVYILTNENSISAATLFPALVVRSNRGVTVGRETRTAYHFMNAFKFANIKLPNSTLTITIPLVKIVFDDVINDRVPYGRGLLPDYHVPLTHEEITYKNGDAILNYTMKLIEEGKYLKGNPFEKVEDEKISLKDITNYIIWGVPIIIIFVVLFIFKKKRRK